MLVKSTRFCADEAVLMGLHESDSGPAYWKASESLVLKPGLIQSQM